MIPLVIKLYWGGGKHWDSISINKVRISFLNLLFCFHPEGTTDLISEHSSTSSGVTRSALNFPTRILWKHEHVLVKIISPASLWPQTDKKEHLLLLALLIYNIL